MSSDVLALTKDLINRRSVTPEDAGCQQLMADFGVTSDPAKRSDMLKTAQTTIAEDYVNGFLFQLPLHTVAKTGVEGLWINAPTQAADMTGVSWSE